MDNLHKQFFHDLFTSSSWSGVCFTSYMKSLKYRKLICSQKFDGRRASYTQKLVDNIPMLSGLTSVSAFTIIFFGVSILLFILQCLLEISRHAKRFRGKRSMLVAKLFAVLMFCAFLLSVNYTNFLPKSFCLMNSNEPICKKWVNETNCLRVFSNYDRNVHKAILQFWLSSIWRNKQFYVDFIINVKEKSNVEDRGIFWWINRVSENGKWAKRFLLLWYQ